MIDELAEEKILFEKMPLAFSDVELLNFLQNNEVSWKHINAIKHLTAFNDEVIAEWLNINVKTFRSYKQSKANLKDNQKEQILLLLALVRHGISVFQSAKDFDKWLNTPNFFLDNHLPMEYLNTITGIRFIDDRLTAMEFGDNV